MVKDRKFIAHRSALQEIMKIRNMIRNNPGNNLNSKEETKRLKILNTVFPWYSPASELVKPCTHCILTRKKMLQHLALARDLLHLVELL